MRRLMEHCELFVLNEHGAAWWGLCTEQTKQNNKQTNKRGTLRTDTRVLDLGCRCVTRDTTIAYNDRLESLKGTPHLFIGLLFLVG